MGRGGLNLFVRKEGTGSFKLVTHPPALSGKERRRVPEEASPAWSRGLQRLPALQSFSALPPERAGLNHSSVWTHQKANCLCVGLARPS